MIQLYEFKMSSIYNLFENMCKKVNAKRFVIWCNSDLSLTIKSNQDVLLASHNICRILEDENIPSNIFIAIIMEHNLVLPAVILAINKHGASFIPVDINSSSSHVSNIMNRLQVKYILFYGEVNELEQFNFNIIRKIIINVFDLKLHLFILNNENNILFPNICYGICTSGTTGESKIVQVPHYCIISNILSLRNLFDIREHDTIFLCSPITFDPSIIELFLSFMTGASLIIVSHQIRLSHKILLNILFPQSDSYNGITFLQLPPSLFLNFSYLDIKNVIFNKNSTLKILALGGEKFPDINIIKKLKIENPKIKVFNLYGITEISCWASFHEFKCNSIDEMLNDIPLGNTLNDTFFQVKDEFSNIIESGIGELFIGSENRICIIDGEEMATLKSPVLRGTGDIVKIDENKNIFFLYRKNNIIKKFGHKILLSQIETVVTKYSNAPSVCIWDKEHYKLILFVVQRNEEKIDIKLLKQYCYRNLPKASYPDKIEIISYFPLTKHGKIDLKHLLKSVSGNFNNVLIKLNPEELLKHLICQYCDIKKNNFSEYSNKSFINLGGTSILAMQIINEFERLSNINLPSKVIEMLLDQHVVLKNVHTCFKESECDILHVNKPNFSHTEKVVYKTLYSVQNSNNMKIVWKYNMEACIDASPLLIDLDNKQLLAIGSHSHIFSVIDVTNGNCISKCKLADRIESTACSTPCKQYVIVGCYDGCVYCINITSGCIKWKYKTGDKVKCTPTLCLNGTAIVIGSYDKNIHCVSVQQGKKIWKTNVRGSVTASPLVKEKCIYIATILGHCFCLEEKDGSIKWDVNVETPIFGSACSFENDGLLFIVWPNVKGQIHFLNSNNGETMYKFVVNGMIYSSLIHFEKNIYFGSHDRHLYCLCPEKEQYNEKFKIEFDSTIFATPFLYLHDNELFCIVACSNGGIYIIDNKTLSIVANIKLSGEVFSSPVLSKNMLYVGCRDDFMYCINIF